MLNFKSTAEPAFDYSALSAHELADLLPMIDDVNFENLKADIAKNGILEPILIFEGRILDGRNRYRAGKEARQTNACEVQDVRRQLPPKPKPTSSRLTSFVGK